MGFYDIFNGDADGLCALQQLRLAEPCDATLVTGVKRDILLLDRVTAMAGDRLTVLDISLDANRAGLMRALDAGAHCRYFDHHFAGNVPVHPLLEAHVDTSAATCTSLIVDRHLGGRHRAWAVVAAFGDNLHPSALEAARALNPAAGDLRLLRELGECLNYNAYGESVEDLHFRPEDLYRGMRGYADPLAFAREAPQFATLRDARDADLAQARALREERPADGCVAVFMPDTAWSRRVCGVFANELAQKNPGLAIAILVGREGGYRVSLRGPGGIQHLARQFESGNGRETAAGIQFLPAAEVDRLMRLIGQHPGTNAGPGTRGRP